MFESHFFVDEVDVDLDVLCATIMDGIGSHINRTDKQWSWTARADAVDVGDSPVLSLSTGAGDRGLTLFRTRRLGCRQGRPSSRTWIAKVGAPSPVGVGVCRQGGDGADTDVKTGGEYALHIA